jgi:hypothetical protein
MNQKMRLLVWALVAIVANAFVAITVRVVCFHRHLDPGSMIVVLNCAINIAILMIFFMQIYRIQAAQKRESDGR